MTQVSGLLLPVTSLYWNEGMDYIAYYPYKEGVTIDTSKTIDEIMTSLVDNEKLKPGADQSGSDEYTPVT